MVSLESPQKKSVIIAIDGPAGAGKTTTAKEVARRLGFTHMDTGAMYRAIALKAIRSNCNLKKPDEIARIAESADVQVKIVEGIQRIYIGGEDVTELVRSPEVTKAVSPVSEVPEVRVKMVELQRKLGADGCFVVEGRDIGTVVFPDAQVKIFLTAELSERTKRRSKDVKDVGNQRDLTKIAEEISARDLRDENRQVSPLKQAADAELIDTTYLSFEEQVETVIRLYTSKCG